MAFPILLLAFILVPIVEIALLIKVGSAIGPGATILVVIFTAILGAYLVRRQGFATLNAVQTEMQAGRVPALQIAEGVALLFAGAVLLTPGFVTDVVGFALLMPFIRQAMIKWCVAKGMIKAQTSASAQGFQSDINAPKTDRSRIIEGEFSERD